MAERGLNHFESEQQSAEAEQRLFQAALAFHQAGNLSQAKKTYEELLLLNPGHFDALHYCGVMARRLRALQEADVFFTRAARVRDDFGPLYSNHGLVLHDMKRFASALACYDRAICLMPDFAPAYFNRGMTLDALGRFVEALNYYDNALAIQPFYPDTHNNRGNTLKELGRVEEALVSYDRAISLMPGYDASLNNRGVTLKDLGRFDEALICYVRAITLKPDDVAVYNNQGILLQHLQRYSDAVVSLEKACSLEPGFALAYYNHGAVLSDLKRHEEALSCYEKAIIINSFYADAQNNRGNALKALARFDEACLAYCAAISVKADHADFYSNLGVSLQELKLLNESLDYFHKAILLNPLHAGAYSNRGVVLKEMRRFEEAVDCYDRAIIIRPDYAEAHSNRGVALQDLKRFEEAMVSFNKAILLDRKNFSAHSNLLFTMNYVDSLVVEARVDEAKRFGASVARNVSHKFKSWVYPINSQKLRIGFVSGDFRNHPVGYFLEGLFSKMDQTRFDLYAYTSLKFEDGLTQRLKNYVPVWRSICDLDDADAAALVHGDGPHILIDLSGHTANNRLGVFAYKPAPVQASWLGYFATTGVAEIDFFVGDPHVIARGEEEHFCERAIRLPETYFCFTPPLNAPDVRGLPAVENGFVTFGCFNNLAKLNARVVLLWARVLNVVHGSRLLLKAAQLGDPDIIQSTKEMFMAAGVGPERLMFDGPSNRYEYFDAFNRIDIALDPFPFPGGTTSVEGLWMGVPVITLRGDRFIAHNGETIAHNCGQANWIAEDEDDYVCKAAAFSSDLAALAKLRAGLRRQVLASPLFDAERFARHFESLMVEMWNDYTHRVSFKVEPLGL